MKKKEIKSDLIHDKIISYANFINRNPKTFWSYVGGIFSILLVFVLWNNSSEKQRSMYNLYSSNNQNNYIDFGFSCRFSYRKTQVEEAVC